ncbi:MAG: MarC family protein [Caulobacteraceae bacterium]
MHSQAAMIVFTNAFFLTYAALFPIVNPFGSAPLFLSLTQLSSGPERHALAQRVAINSFFLLLGSLFVGSHVLEFFGVSLPILRIAGGLVVTSFGWKQLNAEEAPPETGATKTAPASARDAFYPLTMPLTVGPGSISVAVALGSQRPKASSLLHLVLIATAAVVGIVAIAGTVYLCYRFAERIVAVLGPSGANVVMRLSAFILICIGLQIVWGGWSDLVPPAR